MKAGDWVRVEIEGVDPCIGRIVEKTYNLYDYDVKLLGRETLMPCHVYEIVAFNDYVSGKSCLR